MARELSSTTSVVAVVGNPVRHSLSPIIHNAAFESAGLDWVMVALEPPVAAAETLVDAIGHLGLAGLAVTTPFKASVASQLRRLEPAALVLRSVNTVYRNELGELSGASTDGDGFVASLLDEGIEIAGRSMVMFGAGAAARSLIDALGRGGAARIDIVNRSAGPAAEAAALAPGRAVVVETAEARMAVESADVVINATTIGMGERDGADTPFPVEWLRSGQIVADLVYHPRHTPLLRAAEQAGARPVEGLGMLLHQAALQQLRWTGQQPDLGVMRAAAEAALAGGR